jgi:hypothetical protein
MAKINDYIYNFLADFKNNYKALSGDIYRATSGSSGLADMRYNSFSPESDLMYPSNRISEFIADEEHCIENTFKGISLYEKETPTKKFFDIIGQNPLLNLLYPERDNMRYDFPPPPDSMKVFCSQYDALKSLLYCTLKSHDNIRPEYKNIILLIYDSGNGPLHVRVNSKDVVLENNFDNFYFLNELPVQVINPDYGKNFVFLAIFEFENYAEFTSLNTLNSIPGF